MAYVGDRLDYQAMDVAMRKVKVFIYDHAPPQTNYEGVPEYKNSVPFSPQGIEEHCEIVGPQDAELFICGQYRNQDRWMLEPQRFKFLEGNESRHVYDLEGDFIE